MHLPNYSGSTQLQRLYQPRRFYQPQRFYPAAVPLPTAVPRAVASPELLNCSADGGVTVEPQNYRPVIGNTYTMTYKHCQDL